MGGANSPAGLASRPIRILLCDEVTGTRQVLAVRVIPYHWRRNAPQRSGNRKKMFHFCPDLRGASGLRPNMNFRTREKYCIKCPGCSNYHFIELRDIRFKHRSEEIAGKKTYIMNEVKWRCPDCLQLEFDEYTMKGQPAEWIAGSPLAVTNGIKSFTSIRLYLHGTPGRT